MVICCIAVFTGNMNKVMAYDTSEEVKTYVVGHDVLPYTEEEIYNQLFDLNNKVTVDIDMSNEEMAKLEKDFEKNSKSPIYRMCDVTFTIALNDGTVSAYRIPETGIRMKGNMTRNEYFDVDEKRVFNLIHYKISFQETFDDVSDGYEKGEYYINEKGESKWKLNADGSTNTEGKEARKVRKNRLFGGMKKLDLKWNGNYDNTYIREAYAYKIFNSEGVWAPMQGLCSMNFGDFNRNNTYHLGVYSIHECVDEIFINRRVKDDNERGGDLYKAAWTNNGANMTSEVSVGISDDFAGTKYNYDLKTNKKTSDFSSIKNIITKLNGSGVTKEVYDSVVDYESFVKFAAVSYWTGNPDDVRNNFNNHYIYVYPQTSSKAGQMVYIPYDYDRTLGVTIGWNPDKTGMTGVSPFSAMAEGIRRNQVNPVFNYGIGLSGYHLTEYKKALDDVAANPLLTAEAFAEEYNKAYKLYANDAAISDNLTLKGSDSSSGGGKWTAEERIAKFVFSNEDDAESEDYASSRSNITAANYINAIKSNYAAYKAEGNIEEGYYIEGGFSKWKAVADYMMKYDSTAKAYTYEWEITESTAFIIAHTDGSIYRYKYLTGNIPEGISEDIVGNIVLPAGKYVIKWNDEKQTINITTPGEENSIKLKFNANGGSSVTKSSLTVVSGKKFGTLPKAKRKSYAFTGWYTKKSGGKKITASKTCSFNKTTTLYAHWKKLSIKKVKVKEAVNSSAKTITVKFEKVSGADGYEIEYASDSSYKSSKTKKTTKTTVKLTKLAAGNTYYIRVRAYVKDSTGKNVYGKYTAVKVNVTV